MADDRADPLAQVKNDQRLAEQIRAKAAETSVSPAAPTFEQTKDAAITEVAQDRDTQALGEILDDVGISRKHTGLAMGLAARYVNSSAEAQQAYLNRDADAATWNLHAQAIGKIVKGQLRTIPGIERTMPKADRERNEKLANMNDRQWRDYVAAKGVHRG